jgi:hypothetical protein
MKPTPNASIAKAFYSTASALHLLRAAQYFAENGDHLAASGVSMVVMDYVRVGYYLGSYTLSTATRIRVFAETLGYPKVDPSFSIYKQ